jgi:peroxiredoxin
MAALAGALAVFSSCSMQPVSLPPSGEVTPAPAPDFTLPDVEGRAFSLAEQKGNVVLINFWATWCAPCRRELPMFQALQNQYQDKGFRMVGISLDENNEKVVPPFLKNMGINYTNLLGDGQIEKTYGPIEGLPTSIIVDRQGQIRYKATGSYPREWFEKSIAALL